MSQSRYDHVVLGSLVIRGAQRLGHALGVLGEPCLAVEGLPPPSQQVTVTSAFMVHALVAPTLQRSYWLNSWLPAGK